MSTAEAGGGSGSLLGGGGSAGVSSGVPDASAQFRDQVVSGLSEEALLRLVAPLLPPAGAALVGNGDDCAVLGLPDARAVVGTDVLVEGRHFRREWSGGHDVGARAVAQNLADLAAMGARAAAVVVGLVLPADTPVSWVLDLARGMARVCEASGAGVVGGDLSSGDSTVVAVTALGSLEGRQPVLRSGARPGDVVVHVGSLGCSAAGLRLLEAGMEEDRRVRALPQALRCLSLFRVPRPPLEAGPALADLGATAMMDVSDSLLRDADRMARASGVVIDVLTADVLTTEALGEGPAGTCEHGGSAGKAGGLPTAGEAGDGGGTAAVPQGGRHLVGAVAAETSLLTPVAALLDGEDPATARARARQWVLTGGEDHGVLAAVAPRALRRLPPGSRVVGRVRRPGPHQDPGVLVDGRSPALVPDRDEAGGTGLGWDHFGTRG
ncbi:thiamine-phosphate kinase [Actinomyces wuliandei]|uniref:thiamine-phosphate kinase n=1 Tax=Actinomyces wuliandei TaxID=2057743 RepID=UPI0011183F22|nr:thiamine-phosphate kinase [Actinomyces wuliandei]